LSHCEKRDFFWRDEGDGVTFFFLFHALISCEKSLWFGVKCVNFETAVPTLCLQVIYRVDA